VLDKVLMRVGNLESCPRTPKRWNLRLEPISVSPAPARGWQRGRPPISDNTPDQEPQPQPTELDPAQLLYLRQKLESEQNLPLGVLGGIAASFAGAAVWAGVTVVTGYQIGFVAVGIGFLVGFAIRALGKGVTNAFGVVGAVLSLFGCALGNLMAVTALVASQQEVPFLSILSQLNPEIIQELMVAFFSPMDVLFYGIALYYGYKLAFRQITPAELEHMLSGGASAPR
jgi:hypothetical protein